MPSESVGSNLYGVIKNYDVRYRLADSDEEWVNVKITKDQGSNGYKITSLKAGADYEVSVSKPATSFSITVINPVRYYSRLKFLYHVLQSHRLLIQ